MAVMQAQIQALLAATGGVGAEGMAAGSNVGPHMEVAKPAIFKWRSRESRRIHHIMQIIFEDKS